jgi:energy-coupling factor transporter ATP-binding protein EcfA2
VDFARPDGSVGSGLTTIVGTNNVGKSTIVEVLAALASPERQTYSQGKRNLKAGDRVVIRARDVDGGEHILKTIEAGGSETDWISQGDHPRPYVLPSRRYFSPYFGRDVFQREQFAQRMATGQNRGAPVEPFSYRLFNALENRTKFDALLSRVISPLPDWTIDQSDSGQYFLKFLTGGGYHTSEGLGEGLVSLFFVVDALYDSKPGDIIVIDEPELSLHPPLQRRLMNLLLEYAGDRQIICATHSPYFVDIAALTNGAEICRVFLRKGDSQVARLQAPTAARLGRLLGDMNNPHVLGLDAREVFFLEDDIILLEGQEDVIFYDHVAKALGVELVGNYFGWGVGGADKMSLIAQMLSDLGYRKVVGFLDKNRQELLPALRRDFAEYLFEAIPADDVRTKSSREARPEITGLLDEKGVLREDFREPMRALFEQAERYFRSEDGAS